ncbi:hypothetical protein [Amycolatopsis vancoresmycina]|uniref:Uncharacterized protein n=1 Tax=Amycolatopsis vancoresmycina DSM 44592 TaxID=1292037 RepID=R1G711_9PSEU|nr:hypothetical protein [Amycolatopsis vancoresmycina]EOD67247.1 hypothetical protein H480_17390 [Amycolatopsis vancoresmycina DSM 44592]
MLGAHRAHRDLLSAEHVFDALSPTDPNPANDSASKTCSALTGLIVTC